MYALPGNNFQLKLAYRGILVMVAMEKQYGILFPAPTGAIGLCCV